MMISSNAYGEVFVFLSLLVAIAQPGESFIHLKANANLDMYRDAVCLKRGTYDDCNRYYSFP